MDKTIKKWFLEHREQVEKLAQDIFAHPELSAEEEYACCVTGEFMEKYGFEVKKIIIPPAQVENCLIAKWGSGKPVIGILGEYDALPGLGQEPVPYRAPIEGPGHGCGHCLMAAGCAGGAAALKAAMEENHISGTVILFGCPAEEGLGGKVQMLQTGCFDGVDVCISWHDGGPFRVAEHVTQSLVGVEFIFRGQASHAACDPEKGRSALDALQMMNLGTEFLREHVKDSVRMHYIIQNGGIRPNIVPDYASAYYYIRSDNFRSVSEVLERVKNIARGAALMTDTKASFRIISGGHEPILNHTLNKSLFDSAQKVPNIKYDEKDYLFAKELYKNINGKKAPEELDLEGREFIYGKCGVLPTHFSNLLGYGWPEAGATDVNDVSQVIPTVQLFGGSVMGIGGHNWGVTAAAGSSVGRKASIQAGKYIAQFGLDIFQNPEIVEASKKELEGYRKNMEAYKPVLPTDEILL